MRLIHLIKDKFRPVHILIGMIIIGAITGILVLAYILSHDIMIIPRF